MPWTVIYWECDYKGKTLPQVLFTDPDWFFYMIEEKKFENKGPIADEAKTLALKARRIRIPDPRGEDLVAEYGLEPSHRTFAHLELVPRSREAHAGATITERMDVIDLSYPREFKEYDKLGNHLFLLQMKHYLFGRRNYLMTRKRCEAFYDDDRNFVP